jgi:hypothetical protein
MRFSQTEVASPHYITTEAQKACDSGPFTIPELCVPAPCSIEIQPKFFHFWIVKI